MDTLRTLQPITAGALATATCMYPVDLVRALKMSSAAEGNVGMGTLMRNFYAQHGAKGFVSQGVGAEMLRATYMRVSKFFLFPIFHRGIYGNEPAQGTVGTKMIAAAICSLPEGVSIAPIETAKIALQLDKTNRYKNSMANFTRETLSTRGASGLFTGYFGIAYRQTSWTAAYFATLGDFQRLSRSVVPDEWDKTQRLVGGSAAGVFGSIFNTPGDVIRSTIQKRVLAGPAEKVPFSVGMLANGPVEFFATGRAIVQHAGVRALWSGWSVKAVHLGGSGALLATLIPVFSELMGVKA